MLSKTSIYLAILGLLVFGSIAAAESPSDEAVALTRPSQALRQAAYAKRA